MNVYLVPVGRDRFECYYEAADQDGTDDAGEGAGFLARMRARFNQQLQEAERARHQRVAEAPTTFLARLQKRSMRWMADRIAEQRLLWHLRNVHQANLHASDDLAPHEADAIMRAGMKRDADRHRNRMLLYGVVLIAVTPVALVPGPNVLGYLFTFTVVGHFLAWRGAVRALSHVTWSVVPDAALTDLRRAFSLDREARHQLIHEVAARLHLPKVARFVERMSALS